MRKHVRTAYAQKSIVVQQQPDKDKWDAAPNQISEVEESRLPGPQPLTLNLVNPIP